MLLFCIGCTVDKENILKEGSLLRFLESNQIKEYKLLGFVEFSQMRKGLGKMMKIQNKSFQISSII